MSLSLADAAPLLTDADVTARVGDILDAACRHQWWMFLLDADGMQLPLLVPVADLPDPDDDWPGSLSRFVSAIASEAGAAQVVFVWERPGAAGPTDADRAWARRLARGCAELGTRVRGQVLLLERGPRWFPADEYGIDGP